MKLFKKILLTGFILFSSQFLFAGSDYVTIVVPGNQPERIIISENGIQREVIELEYEGKEYTYNYNELIKVLKRFESQGYKVKANEFSKNYNYFLLIREN